MKSSEYKVITDGEATISWHSVGDLCQEGGPTLRRSSTYRSGHGTDQGTGKKWQFGGVNATPNWTTHPSPSRLLKRDRRRECT